MAGFPVGKAKQYVKLYRKKKAIEASLQQVKDRLGKLEAALAEAFAASGIQNINCDGATVFLGRQIWASAATGQAPALAEAMRSIGLEEFVKESVNASQLSAYVRELPRDADDMPVLPAELVGLVNTRDVMSVRVNETGKEK